MRLKDGLYLANDMFYPGAGWILAVSDGSASLARGAGPDARLRAEVSNPGFGWRENIPGDPGGRGPFAKAAVKALLASAKDWPSLSATGSFLMEALTGCSVFEGQAMTQWFAEGGLAWKKDGQRNFGRGRQAPAGPRWFDGCYGAISRAMAGSRAWPAFKFWLRAPHDEADERLRGRFLADRNSVPGWEWTEEDAEESLEILEDGPLFRELLAGSAV